MKRTFWITVALVAAAAAATALLQGQPQTSMGPFDGSSFEAAADVRVRHEFVTIAAPAASQLLESQAPPIRRQERQTTTSADEPLLSKARRTLVGDGRHRPEPFPRIK